MGAGRVYIDGGRTIQSFLSAGLVDKTTVSIAPILLGRGSRLVAELDSDVLLTLRGHHATEGRKNLVLHLHLRHPQPAPQLDQFLVLVGQQTRLATRVDGVLQLPKHDSLIPRLRAVWPTGLPLATTPRARRRNSGGWATAGHCPLDPKRSISNRFRC
ncbi:dihydrofolate reductase family protein [Microbacterium sp. SL75]|uniref:dihydrofolate reductase family protein n=1 Tax=Microbacterium sp. SL75 TaxID=2995140 RepID=UPI00226DCDC8|nr:dihydrofolate reductase family protein [Microbacterium sp. SL75]WAC70189.1 dihydrofolate reductase family protein [Microbacterium sp. SL75]